MNAHIRVAIWVLIRYCKWKSWREEKIYFVHYPQDKTSCTVCEVATGWLFRLDYSLRLTRNHNS